MTVSGNEHATDTTERAGSVVSCGCSMTNAFHAFGCRQAGEPMPALADKLALLGLPRKRARYLLVSETRVLHDWARSLRRMFPNCLWVGQVGSSIRHPNWRDVDVRIMLDDDAFERLTAVVNLLDLNLALSLWGQQITGLPIDCQVQDHTKTNEEFPMAQHPRNSLGIGLDLRPQPTSPQQKG